MATMAMMATTGTTATMAMTATMMPNGDDDYENQAATTARVMTTVARAMVTEAKRVTATMATTATAATTTLPPCWHRSTHGFFTKIIVFRMF